MQLPCFWENQNWQQNLKGGVSSFPCYSLESFSWMFSGTGFWNDPVSFLDVFFCIDSCLVNFPLHKKGMKKWFLPPETLWCIWILYCTVVSMFSWNNPWIHLSILGIKWIKCGGANFSAGAGRLMDLDENLEQRQGIGAAGTSWEEAGSFHRGWCQRHC